METHIMTCHIAQDPMDILRKHFPTKQFYEIFCWDADIGSFFKSKALLWSRQISTKNMILVVHSADRLSVPMMSLITGVLDQGFARSIVFIVQGIDRLPYSIRRKSNIIHAIEEPPLADGWSSLLPDKDDHEGWEKILLA